MEEIAPGSGSDVEPHNTKNEDQMEKLYQKVNEMLSRLGAQSGVLLSDKTELSDDGAFDEGEVEDDETPISEVSEMRQCHGCMAPDVSSSETDVPERPGATFLNEDPQLDGTAQRYGLHDAGKSDPLLGLPLNVGSRTEEAPAVTSPPLSGDSLSSVETELGPIKYLRTLGDVLYKWYTDPFGESWRLVNGELGSWRDQLGWISGLFGIILFITSANLLAWVMMRFMDLIGIAWKFIKMLRFLPIFVICWKFLAGLMKGLFYMIENMQEREKIGKKKNMEQDIKFLMKDVAELKRANGGLPSASSAEGGRKKQKNPLEKQLYTRVVIDGELYSRCMIDTGSDCNLFPTSLMTKHGIPFKKTQAKGIKGFNDQVYETVAGEFDSKVSFCPSKEEKTAHFYVVSGVPCPIIGCPILKDFNISVDVGAHQIIDQGTGMVLSCSSASLPQEKEPPKN